VGDDTYGRRIREEFEGVGTDVELLELRAGYPTPLASIIVNTENGSRTVVNRTEPGAEFHLPEGKLARFAPTVMLFDGHQPEASLEALEAFPWAWTILDAGSLRPGTEMLAARVDYLVASEDFARAFVGIPDLAGDDAREECIRRMVERGCKTVVVTMGERGLIYGDRAGWRHIPAYHVSAVDTTGAGDVFHGAFAWAALREMELVDALRLASAAAAISVTRPGARGSIPELEEAEHLVTGN
jgi:sugar/nucleoside kinase (ribokinase family)